MSETVGDFIVQRLHQWGVRHVFGYPGDGINGVFGALNRANSNQTQRRWLMIACRVPTGRNEDGERSCFAGFWLRQQRIGIR